MFFSVVLILLEQEKIFFKVVLILLGQHCTGKNLKQCCPRRSRQHCTGKHPVQCCLNAVRTTFCRKNTLCNVVQVAPDNILHEKTLFSVVVILLGQHCIGKTQCNIDQETPDNIAQEKPTVLSFERLFWTG